MNEEYNKELIITSLCSRDGSYYGKRSDQDGLIELNELYPIVEMDGFVIVTGRYGDQSYTYLTKDKNDIDNKAYKFINTNFKCTLSSKIMSNGRDKIELETELG